tara:strand:+ start:88 stop:1023 length:936 start_codon:yes stop_codon:yes gene_type:complete
MIKKKIEKYLGKIFKGSSENLKFQNGCAQLNSLRNLYKDITKLNQVELKIFSQNGEDGIIDYLIFQLNIEKPKFLEIGVGDYSESNTRFFYERTSSKGAIIDCIKNFKNEVLRKNKIWKGDLEIIDKKINSENILEVLKIKNVFENLDIFSIDIDGIDYWIIKELPKNFSKIAIIEYNSVFGNEKSFSVPNVQNFNRSDYHYSNLCFGMSLKAAVEIMEEKNFYFVGVNLMRNNAFFISKEFQKNDYFKNLKIDKLEQINEANFRESRDKNGTLNYLSGKEKIKEISECEVVDLSDPSFPKVKIRDLLELI